MRASKRNENSPVLIFILYRQRDKNSSMTQCIINYETRLHAQYLLFTPTINIE